LPTTEAQARELIDAFRSDLSAVETRTVELNADVEATLEDMGYL
jgi:hypothetical protein